MLENLAIRTCRKSGGLIPGGYWHCLPDDKDGVAGCSLVRRHYRRVIQGYTLGILGALSYWKALKPTGILQEIAEVRCLRGLTENIYRHGRKFTASELIERLTGGGLTIDPYIQYLTTKYGKLYTL
jgi:carboxypeptidase Taq